MGVEHQNNKDLTWSAEKDNQTETIIISGTEYPLWVYKRAIQLRSRIPGTLESALQVVSRNIEAERNSTPADPSEPITALIITRSN